MIIRTDGVWVLLLLQREPGFWRSSDISSKPDISASGVSEGRCFPAIGSGRAPESAGFAPARPVAPAGVSRLARGTALPLRLQRPRTAGPAFPAGDSRR